ncbi:MAG: DNA primase [Actinomycetota bacterium]|nr:DNA primase [Actinomycetota bacterium]
MARISQDSVERVKAAADMVGVVSARTQLKRVGGRYTGLCPFHEERTPSFSVNADQKLYYCFGCGKGGDVVSFVEETETLDFAGAVEWLADRCGVQLEYEDSSRGHDARSERRRRLYDLLEHAARFYERHLWESPAGAGAREYLVRRGLGEEICREYRLGFAPREARLAAKARERGYTEAELVAAGLLNRRRTDYFSARLLFPLADARGRVVGFGARRMRDDDPLRAKYVNSPEGELFHKGSLVYGLDRARAAIAKEGRAGVVEGYTDVLALRQAGFQPVVASMGTALTEVQLKELGRLGRRLYLCFDADAAGEAATLRGMELAAARGLDVRVVTLPPGLDPADVADRFEDRLANAERYVAYRVGLELDRAPDRHEAFLRVREVLARIEDSPERQEAVRVVADRLDLPRELQSGLAPRSRTASRAVSPKVLDAGSRLERDALAGCAAHRELVAALAELTPDHFDLEIHRRVRECLVDDRDAAPEVVALLAELDAHAAAEGIDEETGKQLLLRVRERQLQRELQEADLERARELQGALAKVREAVREFA